MNLKKLAASFVVVSLVSSWPLFAQDVAHDWVKVTADAGWRARDSSGELVYKDQL